MVHALFVQNLLETFGAVAVTALWQGAVIAVGLAAALRFAPRASAEHRFYVWAAAFFALVALPLLAHVAEFQGATVAGGSSVTYGSAERSLWSGPLFSLDARWSLLIGGLWILATVFRAGALVLHSLRLRRLWKDAAPVESSLGALPAMAERALTRTRWHRGTVQVCTTTTLQRPSVIGFFRPRILVPDWLLARLTAGELEQIVLHEAEHLRRNDDWTNLLQKISLVLFPLNPALVWIERRLCREREMACDDGVVRVTRAPRAYAACLASLAERGLERRAEALSLGAWQRRPELVHRVHSILRRNHTLGPVGNGALLGALGCSLIFGSVELARCPQLVAFVPARSQDTLAAKQTEAMRTSSPLRMVNAVYRQGRGSVREVPVRALMDGDRPVSPTRTVASKVGGDHPRTASYKGASDAPRAVSLKAELPDAASGRGTGRASREAQATQWIVLTTWEQVEAPNQSAGLIADYDTDASADAAREPAEKAGVLGENGERRTSGAEARADSNGVIPGMNPRPTAGPSFSASSGAEQGVAAGGRQHGQQQAAGQITVTQLIFRIIPASSSSTEPTVVPTRNGWFVLQL